MAQRMSILDVITSNDGTGVYAWIVREQFTPGVGPRPVAWLNRWPALLRHLSTEQKQQYGYEQASHVLVGPIWGGKFIEAGDEVTRLVSRRGGFNHVIAQKSWTIVGRHRDLQDGERDFQVVLLRETI